MTKAKILIVEDNPLTANDLKSALRKFHFEVTKVVSDCDSTLKSIEENHPDLIMMDIDLGKSKNGIEITKEIKKTKKIPVLYLTAFSDEDTMEDAFATDPVGYLIKPFRREELKSTIMLALYKINKLELDSINQDYAYIGFGYYFDEQTKKLYYKSQHIKLGLKERKLIAALLDAKGELIKTDKLEQKIWVDKVPSSSSLRTLIYRLRMKLGCQIIEVSYSNGYKLADIV